MAQTNKSRNDMSHAMPTSASGSTVTGSGDARTLKRLTIS